jgi:hypothetical protein
MSGTQDQKLIVVGVDIALSIWACVGPESLALVLLELGVPAEQPTMSAVIAAAAVIAAMRRVMGMTFLPRGRHFDEPSEETRQELVLLSRERRRKGADACEDTITQQFANTYA